MNRNEYYTHTTLRVPRPRWAEMRKAANRTNRSINGLVLAIVEDWFSRGQPPLSDDMEEELVEERTS